MNRVTVQFLLSIIGLIISVVAAVVSYAAHKRARRGLTVVRRLQTENHAYRELLRNLGFNVDVDEGPTGDLEIRVSGRWPPEFPTQPTTKH